MARTLIEHSTNALCAFVLGFATLLRRLPWRPRKAEQIPVLKAEGSTPSAFSLFVFRLKLVRPTSALEAILNFSCVATIYLVNLAVD